MNFFDRLQDGLCENKAVIRKLMGNELTDSLRQTHISESFKNLPTNGDQQSILSDLK